MCFDQLQRLWNLIKSSDDNMFAGNFESNRQEMKVFLLWVFQKRCQGPIMFVDIIQENARSHEVWDLCIAQSPIAGRR